MISLLFGLVHAVRIYTPSLVFGSASPGGPVVQKFVAAFSSAQDLVTTTSATTQIQSLSVTTTTTTMTSSSLSTFAPLLTTTSIPVSVTSVTSSIPGVSSSVPTSQSISSSHTISITSSSLAPLIVSITTTIGSPTPTSYAYLNEPCGANNGGRHAAPALHGNPLLSGLCCSVDGYAGAASDFCSLANGCQPAYGRCDNGVLPIVHTTCVNPGEIALTFDDGPSVLTSSLLDYLKTAGIKATFFVNGIGWKADYLLPFSDTKFLPKSGIYERSAVLLRAYQEGHQVASHSWSHVDLLTVNEFNLTYEVTRLNHAFKTILGVVPTLFRPPYGDYSDSSLKVLQGLGYGDDTGGAIVTWLLDSVDYDPSQHGDTPPEQIDDMVNEFVVQSAGGPASGSFITLNHDASPETADFRPTGTLLPNKVVPLTQRAVELLKTNGWKFVRVDECLGRPVGSMYRAPNRNDDVCGDSGSFGGFSCTA